MQLGLSVMLDTNARAPASERSVAIPNVYLAASCSIGGTRLTDGGSGTFCKRCSSEMFSAQATYADWAMLMSDVRSLL